MLLVEFVRAWIRTKRIQWAERVTFDEACRIDEQRLRARAVGGRLEPGDRVMTLHGRTGTVVSVEDERATVAYDETFRPDETFPIYALIRA